MLLTHKNSIASILAMRETELAKYVEQHGQAETGRRVGLTQGAIWQMLKTKRNIFVIESDSGEISLEERKRLGKAVA
jgi:Cro